MTTKITLWLTALIAGFFLLDHYVLHWGTGLFLSKKLLELITFLAFWR